MKTWGIIFLLLFIVLLGSAAFVVYQKGVPTQWARLKIISSLEERMDIHARVDNVAFAFPNRVVINGLSISPLQAKAEGRRQTGGDNSIPSASSHEPLQSNASIPACSPLACMDRVPEVLPPCPCPIVKVKQIIIKCRLWDIILRRHPSSYGIDKVIITSAEFYFSRSRDGVWNTKGIFKPGKLKSHSPPEISLFTKNSRIIFQDDLYGTTTSTVLSEIKASYVNGRFKAKALSGGVQSESLTPVHCSGIIHAVSPIDMNWDIGVKKANLSAYSRYLNLPFGQVLDGDVRVNLKGRATCSKGTEEGTKAQRHLETGNERRHRDTEGMPEKVLLSSASTSPKTPVETGTKLPSASLSPQNRKEIKIGDYIIYELSGQIGVQDGRFLLKNAKLPFNQVNGVFRLSCTGEGTKAQSSKGTEAQLNPHPVPLP
ncbi:hypothetical protein HY792_07575 [Candidatus Desantisbacteria bacterium]|nr:hypothetical protein [Candidatus Desantisbacteria bacterium]